MKLIIIFGPPAVGKMTIGQHLEQLTGLPLLHNHLSLELVNRFFDFGTPAFDRLDREIRFAIFREIARSNLPGLIFTFVWALNEPDDRLYIEEIIQVFDPGTEVFFVELMADQRTRLNRNDTENRLFHKPSKRDLAFSEKSLLRFDQDYRMNSMPGEFDHQKLLKIDTTIYRPDQAAHFISDFIVSGNQN